MPEQRHRESKDEYDIALHLREVPSGVDQYEKQWEGSLMGVTTE